MRRIVVLAVVLLACGATAIAGGGSSLRVSWGTPAPGTETISLLPIDVALPAETSREQAIRMWTREMAGTAQQWNSLPAGTYQIVLRGEGAPIDLGEVILAPGEQRQLSVAIPERAVPPALHVLLPERPPEFVLSQWINGARIELQPKANGSLLEIENGCVDHSLVILESAELLGGATIDGNCDAPIRMALVRKATFDVQVTAPRGAPIPRYGVARFAKCGTEIPFAVSSGKIHASIASGCGEISLRIAGFAPVSLAGNRGTIALREGAAAVLRVRSAHDGEPRKGVRVTAVRANDLTTLQQAMEIEPIAIANSVSGASGWVRLDGLPTEPVVFLLQTPERQYPQVSEPYTLEAGEETVIEDLVLAAPAKVFVSVTMAKGLEKSLALHSVQIRPTGHNYWPSRVPIEATSTDTGYIAADVPPGPWEVVALCRLNKGFFVAGAKETIEVAPGMDVNVSLSVKDPVYTGRVTRDGAPVTGVLNLSPSDPRDRRKSVAAMLGTDGTFQVLVEPGEYKASVNGTGFGIKLGRVIRFSDPEEEVEIDLPTRRIEGRVVDSTGMPVGGVMVSARESLREPAGSAGGPVAADGSFVIEGVDTGVWEVAAYAEGGTSEPVILTVSDAAVEGMTLTFEPTRKVNVRVIDVAGAPLRDAFVTAQFPRLDSLRTKDDVQMTRADGTATFRLTRSEQADLSTLVVVTSDFRLSCALRRLDADQTITISPAAGEVSLVGGKQEVSNVRGWLLSSGGCAVPFLTTRVERDGSGETIITFPRLAADAWTYVETHNAEEQFALLTGRTSRLAPLKRFEVLPGRTTRVDLPRK